MPAQGGVKFSPTCDLDYQVRTKSGEGQLTAACPHRGVNWTIRFGLSQGRSSDSSQQHARTGGRQILSYVWLGLSRVRAKSGEGQLTAACPHRGGFKFSPTCELDYLGFGLSQVRLYDLIRTAHSSMPTQGESDSLLRVRWTIRFGL